MSHPFIGSEAVAAGQIVKSALRRRYTRLFPDVYVSIGVEPTAEMLARAGWLWSFRKAVVAGRSAAALLGTEWVDGRNPVDLIYDNRSAPTGIKVRGDRLSDDEIRLVDGMAVTTPLRTALDVACWYPPGTGLAVLDALARAAPFDIGAAKKLAERYRGRRGIRRARQVLELVDAGAQSPKESWLRLLLVDGGLPRPQTQIPVYDEYGNAVAYLDMGWEDIKVAAEYDGEQHRNDRRQYTWDIRRLEMLERLGWIVVRVVAGDRPIDIIRRVQAAIARRTSHQSDVRRSA
jgi:hypothetical protein